MQFVVMIVAGIALGGCGAQQASAPTRGCLQGVQEIPLPGVEGRIDHLVCDVSAKRLYIAALGNGTLEIVDLETGKPTAAVRDLKEPQGVVALSDRNLVAFTSGGDGKLHVVDVHKPSHPESVKLIDVGGDADNLRLDASAERLYVGIEDGLAVVDTKEWRLLSTIKLAGHAESFQVEKNGTRIFVNVPSASHVAVVDRAAGKVVTTWDLGGASANYPMALDEADHRLYVACRKPAQLLVFDTTSGKRITSLDCGGDCDDVFFDPARRRLYATCGEGCISIFEKKDADHFAPLAKVSTAAGARTSLFVPDLGRLYVAVPHRDQQGAEIRVFEVKD
jgi:DNA-binding beta-propeller fold protein YncE